jgi:integrase
VHTSFPVSLSSCKLSAVTYSPLHSGRTARHGFNTANRLTAHKGHFLSRAGASKRATVRVVDVPKSERSPGVGRLDRDCDPRGPALPARRRRRTIFDAVAKDYVETILAKFDDTQRDTRTKQLMWWAKQFAGLTVAEVTADLIAKARDACAAETFTKGKPHKDKKTGEMVPPKEFKRTPATVNRYIAALSHAMTFAVKERRLVDRNPVGDIRREKEPRGRTRFLSDDERTALLDACEKSEWASMHALVLLAITTGARRGELISLRWADVDMKAGRALVRETKNDEQRTLPLAGKALEALRELKARRAANTCSRTRRGIRAPLNISIPIGTPPLKRRTSTTFISTIYAILQPRCWPLRDARYSKSRTCSATRRLQW